MVLPTTQEITQEELLKAAQDQAAAHPVAALELVRQVFQANAGNAQVPPGVLLRIGQSLYDNHHLSEALEVLRSTLAMKGQHQSLQEQQEILKLLGRICREKGELDQSSLYLQQAISLARRLNNLEFQADLLNQQAGVFHAKAQHTKALQALSEAVSTARRLGNRTKEASYLNNVGVLQTYLGDFPLALQNLSAAHQLLCEAGENSRDKTINLISIGNLYDQMSEPHKALEYYQQALGGSRQAGFALIEIITLINMTQSYQKIGMLDDAEECGRSATELARKCGSEKEFVHGLDGLAQVYQAKGNPALALRTYVEVVEKSRTIGLKVAEIDGLLGLGRNYLALNDPQTAIDFLQECLAVATKSQQPKSIYQTHQLLADAHEAMGDLGLCVYHLREYHRLERKLFNEESERKHHALSSMLELERVRMDTESFRIRTEAEQNARIEAERKVEERTRELEQARLEVVARLALAAEYRDDRTGEHTWRVGRNAALIAKQLGWTDDDAELIRLAARLHDVGKIGIPDAILLKPEKLTQEEFDLMKAHAVIGGRILSGAHSRLLQMAEEIAVSHHERWDGRGYPKKLSGEAIPLVGRIVAVADVLDALTHERPYKPAWTVQEALEEMSRQSGQHFDPQVMDACLQVFWPADKDAEAHMRDLDSNLLQTVRLERLQLGIEQQEADLVQR